MVIPIEELTSAYRATPIRLDPSARFLLAAKQLGIRGPDARKDARWRLVRAEIIPKATHGGRRWSLEPHEDRTILGEFDNYLSSIGQIFIQTRRYPSPVSWVAKQTGYSEGAVKRALGDELGDSGLEMIILTIRQFYKDLKRKRSTAAYKNHSGDPRAATQELGYTSYKQLAADWRAIGLSVKVDYRTVEARRNRISGMSVALTALDKKYTMHSVLK